MGFLAQLGVVVLTQSVARKPFHDKCNIKKPTKNKAFSLNLATFGTSPTVGLCSYRGRHEHGLSRSAGELFDKPLHQASPWFEDSPEFVSIDPRSLPIPRVL